MTQLLKRNVQIDEMYYSCEYRTEKHRLLVLGMQSRNEFGSSPHARTTAVTLPVHERRLRVVLLANLAVLMKATMSS